MKALSIAVAAFSTFHTTRPRLFTFPNPSTSSSLLLPSFKLKRFSIFSVQQTPPALGFYAGVTTMVEGSAFQPLSVQVKDHIDLSPKEEQIFNRLLQVVEHYNMGTQLRVAGGWVRDKVLIIFIFYWLCFYWDFAADFVYLYQTKLVWNFTINYYYVLWSYNLIPSLRVCFNLYDTWRPT